MELFTSILGVRCDEYGYGDIVSIGLVYEFHVRRIRLTLAFLSRGWAPVTVTGDRSVRKMLSVCVALLSRFMGGCDDEAFLRKASNSNDGFAHGSDIFLFCFSLICLLSEEEVVHEKMTHTLP